MPWRVIAFALGVWSLQQQAVLPSPSFLAAIAFAGGGLLLAGRCDGLRRARLATGLFGAGLLGLAWAGAMAQWRLADALPPAWEGRDIELRGTVASLPQVFERGVRFEFLVDNAGAPVPRRIALNWYRIGHLVDDEEEGEEEVAPHAGVPMPHAGDQWRFVVRLKRPQGYRNPHGFDLEGWLFERNVRATGYVRAAERHRCDQPCLSIDRLRESARDRILKVLADRPYAGIVTALALGDQQAVSGELWRLFAATGITHLMSISGLHVTLIGALIAWLTNALWRRSSRLPLAWPAQKAAAVGGLAGAFAYALFAGFGVPAQRTLYMLAAVVMAMLTGRTPRAGHVLGLALLAVLLLDPWAVLAAGFWLSFGAVALLFFIGTGRLGRAAWWVSWGRAQWAMTVGLVPALLALFQAFSLVSPLANAVAIPVVSLLVTPLALLGCLPGLGFALELAHHLLVPLMALLQWLAAIPGATWQQHAPPVWTVLLALAGTLWLLLPRGWPSRWLGALLFLPVFFVVPPRPGMGEIRLTVLDVGQGQAVHVQTATHDLLFDTGSDFGGHGNGIDAGSRILVPYLRAVGIGSLDTLVVSHADRDHAGGAASLLAALPVREVFSSAKNLATTGRRCVEGEAWAWDGVRFELLHPARNDYDTKRPSNAMSCVLQISGPHGRILIPGDLEGAAEAAFLDRHGSRVQAEVLVAPHHGGARTSSPALVAAVAPRAVIFPVGYRNRFAHPREAVVERYRAAGASIHRTDRDGAVTVQLAAAGLQIVHQREADRRYWHNAPESTDGSSP